jgi:hypothetical protein
MEQAGPAPRQNGNFKLLTKWSRSPVLSRWAIVNHFRRHAAALAPATRFPALKAFLPQNIWPWVRDYLKYAFTPRYRFPVYPQGNTGIYRLAPAPGQTAITIGIAGDWATGTFEAQTIADRMASRRDGAQGPDLTIHLGDVYYVGDAEEVAENCLGKAGHRYAGVLWPHGTQGSFALNGNHEMYANGGPYFTAFLPSLGLPSGSGQAASYFCLETDWWRILALDTGYNSVGIPILSLIPGINRISAVGGDCHLEDSILRWLRETVRPREHPKATLLLSHHPYYTAFSEQAVIKPAQQLKEFFQDQDVVWMWGHEHRLAIYAKYDAGAGLSAYGRCAGHGGMPVEMGSPNPKKAPLLFYDARTHRLDDGSEVGENGFVLLHLEGPTLRLDYRDIADTQLLVEQFTAQGNGAIEHTLLANPGILRSP